MAKLYYHYASNQKVLIVLLSKKNLVRYRHFQNRSVIAAKFLFFEFQYYQILKFIYPVLYVKINFLCFIMFCFFWLNQHFAIGLLLHFC